MAKKSPAKKLKSEDLMYLALGMASLAKDKVVDAAEYLAKETGLAKSSSALQKKMIVQGKKDYATMMHAMEKGVKKASTRANAAVKKAAKKAKK